MYVESKCDWSNIPSSAINTVSSFTLVAFVVYYGDYIFYYALLIHQTRVNVYIVFNRTQSDENINGKKKLMGNKLKYIF